MDPTPLEGSTVHTKNEMAAPALSCSTIASTDLMVIVPWAPRSSLVMPTYSGESVGRCTPRNPQPPASWKTEMCRQAHSGPATAATTTTTAATRRMRREGGHHRPGGGGPAVGSPRVSPVGATVPELTA